MYIVGCGDIGRRVARRCLARGRSVQGLVRSSASAHTLRSEGINPVQADLDEPRSLPGVVPSGSVVFYFAPPPPDGDGDPRMTGFLAAMDSSALPEGVVYISTSAVYGDCAGEWISEQQPLKPGTARGRRRLSAEQALLQWGRQTGVRTVILRVPGIYATDRLPATRLRKGLPVLREADSPYTNRIHADDLADICMAAADRGKPGAAYHVSDGHPTTMCDYFNRVADYLGLERPPQIDLATAEKELSAGMLSFMGESKRLRNDLMLSELGVVLKYPDLAAGLRK